jgi:hypothetical protein
VTWSWRYQNAEGAVVAPADLPAQTFPTQADAETWIGEVWRELLDGGVDQVLLLDEDDVVYGPMSLHPLE